LAVKEQDEENENDDQFGENEEENQQFEDFCKRFGKLIRYMKEGEGFGEVALTSHKPRTASVIARNRVEVLVLGKKHYDEVFLGVEREREEFIKKSFPMFDAIGSSQNIRLLLYSFKAKTFNKGDIVVH
jgi:CRP-like cAMP-binding protein